METKLLVEFESLIRERLQALDQEEETASGNRDTVILDQQSVGRLSRMDALQQQAMAKATHQRRTVERTSLTAALTRLENGDFGDCEDCGEPIALPRLRLNPALRRCIDCANG